MYKLLIVWSVIFLLSLSGLKGITQYTSDELNVALISYIMIWLFVIGRILVMKKCPVSFRAYEGDMGSSYQNPARVNPYEGEMRKHVRDVFRQQTGSDFV